MGPNNSNSINPNIKLKEDIKGCHLKQSNAIRNISRNKEHSCVRSILKVKKATCQRKIFLNVIVVCFMESIMQFSSAVYIGN